MFTNAELNYLQELLWLRVNDLHPDLSNQYSEQTTEYFRALALYLKLAGIDRRDPKGG